MTKKQSNTKAIIDDLNLRVEEARAKLEKAKAADHKVVIAECSLTVAKDARWYTLFAIMGGPVGTLLWNRIDHEMVYAEIDRIKKEMTQ